ncbi:MAG: cytochrome c biogenesis protein CcsA [Planctomycetes bacterium]|nr:cytochrome c biogenesis protein CcsA [Planctomycetota bacterium]
MAIDSVPSDHERPSSAQRADDPDPVIEILLSPLKSLASLRLTVALFALAMFIIMIGTLAQDKQGMWEVISAYFRSWVSWIEVRVFFPSAWFPGMEKGTMRFLAAFGIVAVGAAAAVPCVARRHKHMLWLFGGLAVAALAGITAIQSVLWGGFLFPGGAAVGVGLVFNLLAAHVMRFKIQAGGLRLKVGLVAVAIGALVTWLVIAAGHNKEGLQALPFFAWSTLWLFCKIALSLFWLVMVAALVVLLPKARTRTIEVAVLGTSVFLLAGLLLWLWLGSDAAYLGDAGMRILWQLIQSTGAAAVLLIGCILVFKRRGGIVLIHAGVGLLMLGEWFVSWYAVEERMSIVEGQTVSYAEDVRDTELAVVDSSYSDTHDDVLAIPRSQLVDSGATGALIKHDDLPFDVRVVRYFKNSDIREAKPDEDNPATAGHGLVYVVKDEKSGSGADSSGRVDTASAYVRFTGKDGGDELGTYLLTQYMSLQDISEKVTVGDKTYDVALRFKRTYKPYSIHLIDFRRDDYIGTSTAMNFSSDVRLIDPSRKENRETRIWMNNPLRYAGETFYQSSYGIDPKTGAEMTILQVVTNTGWMIPYVSCMLVVTGMLAHFWSVLMRFLRRRAGSAVRNEEVVTARLIETPPKEHSKKRRRHKRKEDATHPREASGKGLAPILVPIVVVLVAAIWVLGKARSRSTTADGFDLAEFGKLPVVFEGRVKPFDTLARNALRKISDYDSFKDGRDKRQPAVRWLLDVIARPEEAEEHRVFRIYTPEIRDTLGLERRKGYHYSLAEIRGTGDREAKGLEEFDRQVRESREVDAEDLSFYQRKALELNKRFDTYLRLTAAFQPRDIPAFPDNEKLESDRQAALRAWVQSLIMTVRQTERRLDQMQVPLAVPQRSKNENGEQKPWLPYATACNKAYITKEILQKEADPAVVSLVAIFDAYKRRDANAFNKEVANYRNWLTQHQPAQLSTRRVAFEAFYNRFAPLFYCIFLYGFALIPAIGAYFGWKKSLSRSAFWLLVFILCLHTFAIICRIYISGRPPITNLYSSAVAIGWICAAVGLVLEAVFRLGFGNLVAAVGGMAALLIAQFLGLRGDTFTVLQAVLDTQFWLTLHVIAIGVGYAATFVAGLLGILYIVLGFFTPILDRYTGKSLARMTYGILCFAIFFSFWGTVLGGLWADDSWGRFWGWDPKENGALLIVLWNAIILHARWAGVVRDRGTAVLAVGGNIVTSWSWFGVNELGVGLHSYGFTEGVLLILGLFVVSQLIIIAIGSLPKEMWKSFKNQDEPVLAEAVKPE